MTSLKKLKTIKVMFVCLFVFCGLINTALSAEAQDVPLPPVNLGQSNFLDGLAGPGWLFEATVELFSSDEFKGPSGDTLPGDADFDTWVTMIHVAKITEKRLFGGFYGVEVLIPIVGIDMDMPFVNDKNSGLGDITVSPFLIQWTDGKLFGKPFYARLNFPVTIPTGDYNESRAANIGSNIWRFNPYFAFTLFLTPKIETSWRLHYLLNGKNDSPPHSFDAESIEPGDAFHLNFAVSYEINPKTRVGIAGYYLKQTTDDRIDGVSVPNSREKVFGIGPGIMYKDKSSTYIVNYYFEDDAENRPEGDRFVFRYMSSF